MEQIGGADTPGFCQKLSAGDLVQLIAENANET
jgi:hypothetical protein